MKVFVALLLVGLVGYGYSRSVDEGLLEDELEGCSVDELEVDVCDVDTLKCWNLWKILRKLRQFSKYPK